MTSHFCKNKKTVNVKKLFILFEIKSNKLENMYPQYLSVIRTRTTIIIQRHLHEFYTNMSNLTIN